jgi:hypothetical protein
VKEHEAIHLVSNELSVSTDYLKFHNPPPDDESIDAIVVMGTSKVTAPTSFGMRIRTALAYAEKHPQATVIFSGKEAAAGKAIPEESGPEYIEAAVMAAEAVTSGLAIGRIRLERSATNTKENVLNSLSMLSAAEEKVLFVSSGYLGRRIDLYLKKQRETAKPGADLCLDKIIYIVDADVQEDASGRAFTEQELKRKKECLVYEAVRIVRYGLRENL